MSKKKIKDNKDDLKKGSDLKMVSVKLSQKHRDFLKAENLSPTKVIRKYIDILMS